MARSLPKVCSFLVTVDLKLKWPELPRGPNYPALPYLSPFPVARAADLTVQNTWRVSLLYMYEDGGTQRPACIKTRPYMNVRCGALSFLPPCRAC